MSSAFFNVFRILKKLVVFKHVLNFSSVDNYGYLSFPLSLTSLLIYTSAIWLLLLFRSLRKYFPFSFGYMFSSVSSFRFPGSCCAESFLLFSVYEAEPLILSSASSSNDEKLSNDIVFSQSPRTSLIWTSQSGCGDCPHHIGFLFLAIF